MAESKSQKRKDRQARRDERRKLKEAFEESRKHILKPVKARLSKKSLPGFLAKNTGAIIQWLKDYQTLFVMSDDYGIMKLDRLSEERRRNLVQNYVDIVDFLTVLEDIYRNQTVNNTNETADENSVGNSNSEESGVLPRISESENDED